MDIIDFYTKHRADKEFLTWVLSLGLKTMAELWPGTDLPPKARRWTALRPGVLTDRELRLFACFSARKVEHMLTDENSTQAIAVAERFAAGTATAEELESAYVRAQLAANQLRAADTFMETRGAVDAPGGSDAAYAAADTAVYQAYTAALGASVCAGMAIYVRSSYVESQDQDKSTTDMIDTLDKDERSWLLQNTNPTFEGPAVATP